MCRQHLGGSLADFYDTKFDGVRARLYEDELAVEYYRDNGEVPVRIAVEVRDGLKSGSYDLKDRGSVTGRSRDEDIPEMVSGSLELTSYSTSDGAAVEGEFEAKFKTGQDETSLTGTFETKLELVGLPGGYELSGYPPPPDMEEVEED